MTTSTQAFFVGDTTPAGATAGAVWLDTSLGSATFPDSPAQIFPVLQGVPGSGVAYSEPNVWEYGGRCFMLTTGQRLLIAPQPLGPWVDQGFVFGSGVGGESDYPAHAGIWIENNILYLYYAPQGAGLAYYRVAYQSLANLAGSTPSVGWTLGGNLLPNASGRPVTSTQWGNPTIWKWQGKYYWLIEALYGGGNSWQSALYSSTSLLGPLTMESAADSVYQLSPTAKMRLGNVQDYPIDPAGVASTDGYHDFASNGPVYEENGRLMMIYHAGPQSSGGLSFLSNIYRGFSYDGGKTWEVDLNGYPLYVPLSHTYEFNGLGDPFAVKLGGRWYCYWSAGNDAASSQSSVMGCALGHPLKMLDGYGAWTPVNFIGRAQLDKSFITRTRYAIGGGSPIFQWDRVPVDPANTANFSVTLPLAADGVQVEIFNCTAAGNTGTVAVSAQPGDTILGTNAALTIGQGARFVCLYQNRWNRIG